MTPLKQLVIGIKGAGEMASAIACRLYRSGFQKIFMMETGSPLAVRRKVSFSEALHEGHARVEGIEAVRLNDIGQIQTVWKTYQIGVLNDPEWKAVAKIKPEVSIDAVMAKANLGTVITEASLVIGLGPGFTAQRDVHFVIETNRGHNLGRIITAGEAEEDTGIPAMIGGHSEERVLRAPLAGCFEAGASIGDRVETGDILGAVDGEKVRAKISGVLRGLIRSGTQVEKGLKIGDIDPRSEPKYCFTISDKARAVSGAVLEGILRVYNA